MILDKSKLPKHIAIIMDGNGRWAKKKRLPRIMGHRAGAKTVKEIVTVCAEWNIKFLTLYAFSAENWTRPKVEINALMRLLKRYLIKEYKNLQKNNIKLTAIGRIEELPDFAKAELKKVIKLTSSNTGLNLNLALNYGGRAEIVDAINLIIREKLSNINEEIFSKYLYTNGLPEPDLLIRTSGEMRISNFMLWQSAYTEIWITKTFWPDFRKKDLLKAILDFQKRDRRFGGIGRRS